MTDFHVAVGDHAAFTKTVGETDVYMFAGITGDFSPNHVDQAYMERSRFGRRQAHGALLVGFMSTTSTLVIADSREGADETPVSLGYDRVRFLAPVYFGDTVTVRYTITAIDLGASAIDRPDRGHQPGRHPGRGRHPHPEVGRQPVTGGSVARSRAPVRRGRAHAAEAADSDLARSRNSSAWACGSGLA